MWAACGRTRGFSISAAGLDASPLPLIEYLHDGSYEGFDISRAGVRWCQRHISPRYPHFTFRLAEVQNGKYNPRGSTAASGNAFPYPDESFDLALAASVFTHMTSVEVDRYVSGAARVLRPGGRLGQQLLPAQRGIVGGTWASRSRGLPFALRDSSGGAYRASDPQTSEHQIALGEADVRRMHERAGLTITAVEYGSWAAPRRARPGRRQDFVVAERAAGH